MYYQSIYAMIRKVYQITMNNFHCTQQDPGQSDRPRTILIMEKNRAVSVYRRHPGIIDREIVDEFILVPVSDELMKMHSFFTLNSVGRFIWEHLNGVNNLNTIAEAIEKSFETEAETARNDLYQLIDELQQAGLITVITTEEDN